VGLAAVVGYIPFLLDRVRAEATGWTLLVIGAGCILVLAADLIPVIRRPKWWLARAAARELDTVFSEPVGWFFLRLHTGNPNVRLLLHRRRGARRLFTENFALVREAVMKCIDRLPPGLPWEMWRVPEVLYHIEKGMTQDHIEGEPSPEVECSIRFLQLLRGRADLKAQASFVDRLALAVGKEEGILWDAFDKGLDRVDLAKLPFVSERQLRDAVRQLSPLEERGLGALDFLRSIADIDLMFLLCSQYLFYTERDLLRGPESS